MVRRSYQTLSSLCEPTAGVNFGARHGKEFGFIDVFGLGSIEVVLLIDSVRGRNGGFHTERRERASGEGHTGAA
jgi:hypothetical protein